MTIAELIIAILLIIVVAILFIKTLIKLIKKGGFNATDKAFPVIVFGAGLLFVIVLAYRYSDEIELGEFIQILLLFVLVTVTSIYAWSASRQAGASVKMAEAAKEQADASARMAEVTEKLVFEPVRPVIDIERLRRKPRSEEKEPYAARQGELPDSLRCSLRNIGLGPAIDVSTFVQSDRRNHQPLLRGTVLKDEVTEEMPLSLEERDDKKFLLAYYRDVHGRCFESRREVSVDTERGSWELGPLKAEVLTKLKQEQTK